MNAQECEYYEDWLKGRSSITVVNGVGSNGIGSNGMNGSNGAANGSAGHVVLLTGSTGALGSHILNNLLRNSNVILVYVLYIANRGTSEIKKRQADALIGQGLSEQDAYSNKIVYVEYSLTENDLGIKSEYLDKVSLLRLYKVVNLLICMEDSVVRHPYHSQR